MEELARSFPRLVTLGPSKQCLPYELKYIELVGHDCRFTRLDCYGAKITLEELEYVLTNCRDLEKLGLGIYGPEINILFDFFVKRKNKLEKK